MKVPPTGLTVNGIPDTVCSTTPAWLVTGRDAMEGFDAARRLYEAKGFARQVGWGERPAVLVVDLTNGFTDPTSPVGGDLSPVIEATRRLLDAARPQGLPVIFTSIAYHDPEREAGHWLRKIPALGVLRHGTAAVEVDARLGRQPGEPVLYKCFASSFFGTHLQAMLQHRRVDTILLCGTSTSGCVRATAIDAVQHGFRCIVPEEAAGDRAEGPHRANLFDIDAKYGDVVKLEEALAELERRAALPSPPAGA
jgi:nicotinamidase-related amidase